MKNVLAQDLFFCQSYQTFYENQVDLIKKGIFDFYSGLGSTVKGSDESQLNQIIEMQKDRITELEMKLQALPLSLPLLSSNESSEIEKKMTQNNSAEENDKISNDLVLELNNEIIKQINQINDLENNLSISIDKNKESALSLEEMERSLKESEHSLALLTDSLSEGNSRNISLQSNILSIESLLNERTQELFDRNLELDSMMRSEAAVMSEAGSLRKRAELAENTGDLLFDICYDDFL